MLMVVILCLNMRKLIVTLSGADFVIKYLAAYQVKYAFILPGYLIDPLLESLTNSEAIAPIICNSELGSGYIADGYARASKNIGLCISIGGPGVSNLITAAFNAKEDESAVFFITGNVPNNLRNVGGFQDVDAVKLFQHNVSYSAEINDPEKLNEELNNALTFMKAKCSTPVHLSIPLDIQNHIYKSPPVIPQIESCLSQEELAIIDSTAAKISEVLSQNTRVSVLAGQRLRNSSSILLQFAEKFNIPIATTAAAKGIFPETHPLSLGTFSISGHLRAKQTLLSQDIEVLLLVGLDFNQQESLQWEADLCAPQRQIIRIDHHPAKCLSKVKIDLDLVVANCSLVLRKIIEQNSKKPHPNPPLTKGREQVFPPLTKGKEQVFPPLSKGREQVFPPLSKGREQVFPPLTKGGLGGVKTTLNARLKWVQELQSIPLFAASHQNNKEKAIPLSLLIRELQAKFPSNTILCVDAGFCRRFAAGAWLVTEIDNFFSAANIAPMGWAISAGIGIKLAKPQHPVIVLTGDGSMAMHGLDIITAVRYQLPIFYVVSNNQGYGTVYQRLQHNLQSAKQTLLPPLNWVSFAQSLGVKATKLQSLSELDPIVEQFFQLNATFLLEVHTQLIY